MELVYLWVFKYKNLENIGFNFSANYDVNINFEIDKESINIKKRLRNQVLFQNEGKLNNITAIIGKNGTGKSNILDILGVRRDERIKLKNYYSEYLIIYHYDEDIFVIEGANHKLISSLVVGIDLNGLVSDPYSMVVKYKDGKFEFLSYLQLHKNIFENNIIFNYRNSYDKEIAITPSAYEIDQEYTILFNRLYLSKKNTGHLAKYKMLIDFFKHDTEEYTNNFKVFRLIGNASIRLKCDIYFDIANSVELKMKKKFNTIISFRGSKRKVYNSKEHFINKLAYSLCEMLAIFSLAETEEELSEINTYINNLPKDLSYIDYCLKIANELLVFKEKNDSFFTEREMLIDIYNEYFKHLNKINIKYYNDENIVIPINGVYDEDIGGFFELLNNLNKLDSSLYSLINLVAVSYDSLSSGEEALISLFSALYYGLTEPIFNKSANAIILLDEPDSFMHPEWSRMLVRELILFLNTAEIKYNNIQLVMTTHSPFIISDLPKENIIALEKLSESNRSRVVDVDETFATNIHKLLSEEFFMTTTIGEFAKDTINEVIYWILNKKTLTSSEKERIEYIIGIIGEPILKDRLLNMYRIHFEKKEGEV